MSVQLAFPTFSAPVVTGIGLAQSIRSIVELENPLVQQLLSRDAPLTQQMFNSIMRLSVFSWAHRNPQPAVDKDGNFIRHTDLDLLTWLMGMARRGAVIQIPDYKNFRPLQRSPLERHLTESRFGPIVRLVSSEKGHSFSIRIFDHSLKVIDEHGRESIGGYRNYMVVDPSGKLYDGWKSISWDPNPAEQEFLQNNRLMQANTVVFNTAVHPNRWQSVFGSGFFLLKVLLKRVKEEKKFYADEVDRLLAMGIRFPISQSGSSGSTNYGRQPERPKLGNSSSVTFTHLQMVLEMPDLDGTYRPVPETPEGLEYAEKRASALRKMHTDAQFVAEADVLAYNQYGRGRIAHWMGDDAYWETGYRQKGKRTKWNRLRVSNTARIHLLYRLHEVSQMVAAD